jgi:hypothetical protein
MAYNTNQDILLSEVKNNTGEALTPGSTVHIDDVLLHTGPFFAVTALTDTVVDVSECTTGITENNAGTMQAVATNFTIPKGVTIYGNFTSIELDSGSVLAYAKLGVTVTAASS